MPQIRVHGQRESGEGRRSHLERGRLPKGLLTVKHSVQVGFAREGHEPAVLDGVADDDLIEMELDGGLRLWSSAEHLRTDFGMKASRDGSGTEMLEVTTQLPLGGGQSRGVVGDWIIRGLKVLGVDIAGKITDFVGDKVEGQLAPGPGLYRCSPSKRGDLQPARKLNGGKPTLVFLHGTASSTDGSFGELWSGPSARIGELVSVYGDNILALQHRTLTHSPIENARDLLAALAKVLPPRSELHLVSHSRGGLVGELVARGNRVGGGSFDRTDLQIIKRNGRADDGAALNDLRDLLDKQRYVVSRFVRVACPTRGTTLASGRLDKYLSVILNVLETIPGLSESILFDTFASLLAAVVKKRTDPQELPGLEAMMPESALVRMLNRPDVRTDANLRILGGDVEGTGFFGRLKAFVTDLYYREDHDLVVNTPAMFGGTERAKTVRYWVDTGGRVNHFNYFANADTASRLVKALTDEDAPQFHDVTLPLGAITEDDYRKRAPIPQPVVFVLPGTMGSTLAVDSNRVWLDRLDLARGGMELIKTGALKVRPESLVDGSYRDLVRHLAASHEVVPFPYDWRLPLADSAAALRKAIDAKLDALEGTDQPVRIIAHSMGGLVVRTMLGTADGQATWKRMCAHPGARFVMLGTPNGGSHAIGAMLMGRDPLVKQLALLDLRHDYAEILAIIAEFDGALQLLPHAGTLDLYDAAAWQRLHKLDAKLDRGIFGGKPIDPSKSADVAWTVPATSRLTRARASRDLLRASRIDSDRMIYVAGVADQTATDIVIDEKAEEGRRVTVMATSRGDGRVPWATGIPEELAKQTYYMNAVHGDMANTEDAFPALVDLLSNGTTSKLPKTPPAVRGAAQETFPLREVAVDAFPDDASLAAAALGGRRGSKPRRARDTIRVSVLHDNLVFARWPVLVGHYRDDVFVGAEDYLDYQLRGRLRELQRLDLYPGAYNTSAVVLNEVAASTTPQHPGAIVAGLGTVGELTPGALTATLTHSLTVYGAQAVGIERRRRAEGVSQNDAPELPLRVMALLVGAGAGGVTLADSIQAILRAVQGANTKFAAASDGAAGAGEPKKDDSHISARIAEVQILELFEDRAIQAVHQLHEFSLSSEFRNDFVFDEILVPGTDGEQRVTFDEIPGWWQRVRIARDDKTGDLKFEALTDRARAEASLLPTQQLMVQGLLDRASRSTATDLALSATLFELLVPRTLKEHAPDRRQLVLLVDDTSAMLPWELLHDRWNAGARPLSVDAGMVRQFVTPIFRTRVQRAPADTALVIGDPPLDGSLVFKQLPGAAAEARAVAATLREKGFETTELVEKDAVWPNVLSSLYGHPYRILHIAAHGVHEFEPVKGGKKVTGVVLGNGAFLTPAEFEQFRVVPDMVFINCCHLAAGGAYGREVDVAFWRLAPNVAYQLIRMGVRAVVAAGWAVDDQAAKEFARRFYAAVLDGQEFGQAVLQARQEIYSRYSAVNTWGAYQCYGDPGFSLTPMQRADEGRAFVAERELCYAVIRLGKRVRTATNKQQKDDLALRLERMVGAAQSSWLKSGVTGAAIARAYAVLGRFDEALKYYEGVLVAEPASASIEDIEQLANLMSRAAAGQKKPSRKSLAVMKRSTALLQHLAAIGETVERLSLLGGTAKRHAQQASGAARMQALKEMVKAYEEGYKLAVVNKRSNAWYPLANAVAGKVAMSWLPGAPKGTAASIDKDMKELRNYVKQVSASSDFWELALPADVRLLESALSGQLSASERKAIEGAYRAAGDRAGTPREVASATGQIEFLRDIARASSRAPIKRLAESLEELRKALKGE
jgi:tetratricopeptide (TPR) repeat protein